MKNIIKIFSMFILAATTVVGCKENIDENPVKVHLNKELISNLPVGSSQTLVATLEPKDAVATVVWSSSDETVAVVNEEGEVTGVAPGEAIITAAVDKETATCKVIVTAVKPTKIELNQTSAKIEMGTTLTLEVVATPSNAVVTDLTWSSSNSQIASVADGVVTPVAVGKTTITAKCNGGELAAVCQVEVVEEGSLSKVFVTKIQMPSSLTLSVGEETTLEVVVLPEDATDKSVIFASNNTDCVTVDSKGLVKAVKNGNATITATAIDGSGVSAVCAVIVGGQNDDESGLEAVRLYVEGNATDLQVGLSLQLTPVFFPAEYTPKSISWFISLNSHLASVDQNGRVTGLSAAQDSEGNWTSAVVTVNVDGKECSQTLRVIPRQPESIEIDLPAEGSIRVGEEWNFNPRVLPAGLGYGVTCSITKPGNKFTSDPRLSSDIPGTIAAQFAVAANENLVYSSYRKNASINVLPYWVETLSLPAAQEMEVGGSIILSPEFTSDVEGVQPTSKDLVWTSSDESKATVDSKGKVTALAAGTVEITATTSGSWSVPSGQSHKSAKCTVTIKEAQVNVNVGDFYFSDGTTSSTLEAGKTVIGVVISRDNATSTDKKLPAGCTHGVVMALGEGYGIWSSSYDAGRVNSWATQNGYENTTGAYYSNAYWSYVRNEYGNKLLGHNNTNALKAYIKNNGYTSGILDALAAYKISLPETASELYIPSIAEMDAVAKNFEVINAALKAAGGTEFTRDMTDTQNDAYWTTSENESSSGQAATINPFTGELHGGVMKSKAKKVRFIFAF